MAYSAVVRRKRRWCARPWCDAVSLCVTSQTCTREIHCLRIRRSIMATADGAQEPDKATETAQDKRELKQRLKEAKDPGEVWGIIQHVLTDLTRLEIRTVVTREMTVDGNAGTQGANP